MLNRRSWGISDAEWDAIKHLRGRWHTLGSGLCRVFYSHRQRGWIAILHDRPRNPCIGDWRRVPLRWFGDGRSVIGCYSSPEEALRHAGIFYDLEGGERLCKPSDIAKVRKENERLKSRKATS